ncbi:MAG: class II aldolase/adducin family protein, partial [Oscillospiraceae bacterium]|nr:class II aldolase/adducin family protein [Oscillospiraceae bacterium]
MEYPITNKYLQEDANTIQDAKRMLVLANRILANEGVFDAFGHISIRNPENPETFLITRSLSPELVTMDDILTLDFDGNV